MTSVLQFTSMSLRMGSEGFEPSPGGLKIRSAAVTPRPHQQFLISSGRPGWSRTTAFAVSERCASVRCSFLGALGDCRLLPLQAAAARFELATGSLTGSYPTVRRHRIDCLLVLFRKPSVCDDEVGIRVVFGWVVQNFPLTHVGIEPDLTGVKDRGPHQKSNASSV